MSVDRSSLGNDKHQPDMGSNNLTTLRISVDEDVLDEVVAMLVTSNVDEWHARTIGTTFTDFFQIAVEEVSASNLQTLLNDLWSRSAC